MRTRTGRVIGLLHPGEMGSAAGRCLAARGHTVLWASQGRGPQTAERARSCGLHDVGTAAAMARQADVIFSVGPPHAALKVAGSMRGFRGTYVDANAVCRRPPATWPRSSKAVAPAMSTAASSGRRLSPLAVAGCTCPGPRPAPCGACSTGRRSMPGLSRETSGRPRRSRWPTQRGRKARRRCCSPCEHSPTPREYPTSWWRSGNSRGGRDLPPVWPDLASRNRVSRPLSVH